MLVVEDEPLLCDLVCAVLEGTGCRAVAAADGAEALELAAAGGRFDLLLADAGALHGLGGELVGRLRERSPALRLLVMSGHPAAEVVRRDPVMRGEAILEKPFPLELLARTVRQLLDGGFPAGGR